MAKNTYKQPAETPTRRGNEPRPAEPRPARNQPRPAAASADAPPRENRRNEPKSAAAAKPKKERRPLKLPVFQLGGIFDFLRDRRFQLFLGFFLLFSSIYLTIAFVSFLFTGHADQSVTESVGRTALRDAGQETGNWLGVVGALLAEWLIQDGFGVAAFALIPIVFFLGYKTVFRRGAVSFSYVLALCLFTTLWLSVLLGYVVLSLQSPGIDPVLAHSLDFLCGGVGYETAFWLDSLIGWGTVLLLAFLLISFVVFFFNITTLNLGSSPEEAADESDARRPATNEPAPWAVDAASAEDTNDNPLGLTLRDTRGSRAMTAEEQEADDEFDEDEPAPITLRTGAVASSALAAATTVGGGLAAGASALPLSVAPVAAAIVPKSSGPSFSIEVAAPEPTAHRLPRPRPGGQRAHATFAGRSGR
ncbi:hypothetical protein D0N36_03835 [Hymenobacter lapidiphilus]|uniref:DNA translocase FtsK 4TM domain-containing protein n=1 Tax=Hymenobacter sp. CCM 8763 TaxID=2303334 RepID=UPI000E345830|nr:DNA translocase FtsK 4TM domain-containing protein [Hymenobacter sp. CCM 8763]RFP66488.1 hypothetical protein D0N36_03835 [Hymenobacter sp. CCM 8763]